MSQPRSQGFQGRGPGNEVGDVQKQLKSNFAPNGFLVLWISMLEFLSFCVTRYLHDGRVEFVAKLSDRCFCWLPACWCPSGWAPAWRLHTNLYKFGRNVSPYNLHKKNCCDLKLGESLCIFTFFLSSESGLNLLNGFDFYFNLIYFEWRDTEILKTSNSASASADNRRMYLQLKQWKGKNEGTSLVDYRWNVTEDQLHPRPDDFSPSCTRVASADVEVMFTDPTYGLFTLSRYEN